MPIKKQVEKDYERRKFVIFIYYSITNTFNNLMFAYFIYTSLALPAIK